jgi:hypothetical protein
MGSAAAEIGGIRLKRTTAIVVVLALCIAALAPSAAIASKSRFAGSIDPSGTVSFKVLKKHKKTYVLRFGWRRLPVKCKSGPNTTSGRLAYRVKVKHHKFSTEATADNGSARAKINGKIRGRRAKGTITVSGSSLAVDNNPPQTGNCSSGKKDWKARKQ